MNDASMIGALDARGAAARPRGSGRIWPVLIVALLSMNALIVAITVYFAVSDPSAVSEPDYYATALKYDEVIAQRGVNARLAWQARTSFEPAADGRAVSLVVRLVDAKGTAVEGAALSAEVFSNVRSGQRQTIKLEGGEGGRYMGSVRLTRTGRWNVRLRAGLGDDVWTADSEILVPATGGKPGL